MYKGVSDGFKTIYASEGIKGFSTVSVFFLVNSHHYYYIGFHPNLDWLLFPRIR